MLFLNFYKDVLKCHNEDEVFNLFIDSLKPGILLWSYFVNWEKVFENTQKIEVSLNILNYLIGKKNFDEEFKSLLKQNPQVAKAIPALVVRDGKSTAKLRMLVDYKEKKLVYEDYEFDKINLTNTDIEKYLVFAKETGLKDLIVSQKIKNLVDYMVGVEAGLDSNGRKNRGGHCMEQIVEFFVKDFCSRKGFSYLKEANAKKIYSEWKYNVPVDKSSRRYDFVINTGKELYIFETNFYGGGGSKLKSTASEYHHLFDILNKAKFKFIWITDGLGWKSTQKPLRETFNHNNHVINLSMLEHSILDSLIS